MCVTLHGATLIFDLSDIIDISLNLFETFHSAIHDSRLRGLLPLLSAAIYMYPDPPRPRCPVYIYIGTLPPERIVEVHKREPDRLRYIRQRFCQQCFRRGDILRNTARFSFAKTSSGQQQKNEKKTAVFPTNLHLRSHHGRVLRLPEELQLDRAPRVLHRLDLGPVLLRQLVNHVPEGVPRSTVG